MSLNAKYAKTKTEINGITSRRNEKKITGIETFLDYLKTLETRNV